MGFGRDLLRVRRRAAAVAGSPQLVEVELVGFAGGTAAELADRRQADRQVVTVEGQRPRSCELRAVLDEAALGQPEQDLVGVIGREEAALLGGRGDGHAGRVRVLDEDAVELRALVPAAVDTQRQMLAEAVELADLDRRPERARLQVELQPLVAIVGVRLEVADDEQIDDRERDRIGIGHAQQPAVADADAAQRVELR